MSRALAVVVTALVVAALGACSAGGEPSLPAFCARAAALPERISITELEGPVADYEDLREVASDEVADDLDTIIELLGQLGDDPGDALDEESRERLRRAAEGFSDFVDDAC